MTSTRITRGKKRDLRACRVCAHPFDTFLAQCPKCRSWDAPLALSDAQDETVLLSDVSPEPLIRITGTGPWDKCFSYVQSTGECGLVTVQTVLIGGEPGAGKSTLALQAADKIAGITQREVIYIAAEEAKEQIKDRALRLKSENLHLLRVYPLGASTDLGDIFRRRKPAAVIVDSLPGLTKDPEQAVQYCNAFKEYAVVLSCPFLIIDHVTKDKGLAGLMSLQHEVDTTMLFTVHNDRKKTRQLEAMKNRMGATQSIYLEMTETGLIETDPYEEDDDESDPDWNRDNDDK